MSYISIDTLIEARKYVHSNVKKAETFAGLILFLSCVCNSEKNETYLKSDMKKFMEYADKAFYLSSDKINYSEKYWYALLTTDWTTQVRKHYLDGKKILLRKLVYSLFWYETESEIRKILKKIPEYALDELFISSILPEDFSNSTPIDRAELASNYSAHSNLITIKFDGSFVKKRASDLSGAPFGQTLYASKEIKKIISVYDFDFMKVYDLSRKERHDTTIVSEPSKSYDIENTKGKNILLYGAPGVGKSHLIETKYCNDLDRIERVVFHPDYMNTDFIGQILPDVSDDGAISYDFKAGAFTRILDNAIKDENGHYYLIIEEINRGNAPAIFGEIFQLLDRDSDGISKYAVSNQDIAKHVYNNTEIKIRIPTNLTILATMNTADQNVFTLDTAFQRRWQMRMIENNIDKCNFKDTKILDTSVTWGMFNTLINQHILDNSGVTLSSEDKRLGAYFISEDVLTQELDDQTEHIFFSEKVIKYLWDDVYKFNREQLFDRHYQSLEQVINDFASHRTDKRFNIFNKELVTKLFKNNVLQPESSLDE